MPRFGRKRAVDWLRVGVAGVALAGIATWNTLVYTLRPVPRPTTDSGASPRLVEHERSWTDYLRGFHAHHGPDGHPAARPAQGSLLAGLSLWLQKRCLRGYTIGDHVYLCPKSPTVLRVHQAGHAPSFGGLVEPLVRPRRDDGGLNDEPLRTLDVMLPGDFPHTLLRVTDRRGLRATYQRWLEQGLVRRTSA